jgi:O-antigen/teichoic acid export membrane protein
LSISFGNSAFYLYLETILNLGSGYVFWVIVSILLGASNTGISSASITLATIMTTVSTIGISTGIQRFLGKAKAEHSEELFNSISKFAFLFTIMVMIVSSIIVVLVSDTLMHIFNFPSGIIVMIIISSVSLGLALTLRSVIISSNVTRVLVIALLIASFIRFGTVIPIYVYHLGSEGIVLSYTTVNIVLSLLYLYFARRSIFSRSVAARLDIKRQILISSISGWIPNVISLIGTQSGLLFIFGLKGPAEAGVYFIAFSIFSAISALPMSIISMAYPVMSGMKNGREKLLWQATKMALFPIIPIAVVLGFYPSFILSFFGKDFAAGQLILSLLIASVVPIEINRAVSNLAYAHGKYMQVAMLGIFPSMIRIAFYILLAPTYGGNGAAFAFLVGSLAGLVITVLISIRSQYDFPTKDILAISAIPVIIGTVFYLININQLLDIILVLLSSYISLARFKIVRYGEIEGTICSIFMKPNKLSRQLLSIARVIFV